MPGSFRSIRANVDGCGDHYTCCITGVSQYPGKRTQGKSLFIEAHNFSQNETTSTQNATTPGSYLIEASSGFGGNISPAGSIYVPAGGNKIFSMIPDENYKVLDVMVDGNSVGSVSTYTFNNVSSSHSIQASFTVDFDVQDNTVIPEGNFTVNATVLGSAITSNNVDLPVTCRLMLGDDSYTPWGDYMNASDGNLNDGENPRFWESSISFGAGTPVNLAACSWSKNKKGKWSVFHTVDTPTESFNLKVLKNGDPAADFQDLVILISINGADATQSAVTSQEADSSETSNNTPNEASCGTSNETPSGTVLKFVIEHRGGDTINFKSDDETKVIHQKGDDQRYLNFTELGVFKVGDSAIFDLKYDDEETRKPFNFSQGDRLFIKIVDVPSKSLIYSGSTTVK